MGALPSLRPCLTFLWSTLSLRGPWTTPRSRTRRPTALPYGGALGYTCRGREVPGAPRPHEEEEGGDGGAGDGRALNCPSACL